MVVPGKTGIEPVPAVAIVGAAMRFPGASDPASFHELTVAGRRMFREVRGSGTGDGQQEAHGPAAASAGRATVLAALLGGTRTCAGGGTGTPDHHVLAAEMSAAALADVPAMFPAVDPGRVGAFIAGPHSPSGGDIRDYVRGRLAGGTEPAPASAGAAGTRGKLTVANGSAPRGPSCSLRAMTQACEALNAGEFDLVLAGGVATGIDAAWLSRRMAAGTLASREVRVYDASPTGTLPGEGCGMIALVRAADARANGLPCYAEIAGWHAPDPAADPAAERARLADAYQRAGVDPADIQFVEGHGAATAAEDLAELRTLLDLFGSADGPGRQCALGTVSANIGDTRGAAGIAALLKTAPALSPGRRNPPGPGRQDRQRRPRTRAGVIGG